MARSFSNVKALSSLIANQISASFSRRGFAAGAQGERTLWGVGVTRNIEDHKRRLLADRYEGRRKLSKAIYKDSELPADMREQHRAKLSKLPRNSSFTRIRNRCIVTGRSRSVYKFCRMSRIVFRGLANKGSLVGIKKASW